MAESWGGGSAVAVLLRTWRERALLTQEQLAERAGLGVRTIRRLEAGSRQRPRGDSMLLLADALELTDAERVQLLASVRGEPAPALAYVPRQLPADVAGFSGRVRHLDEMDALLAAHRTPTTMVISAIAGTAGVGKTSLAVHWAHRVADRFPDGQLYVNLRGFDPGGAPAKPAAAVRGFLDALGVPAERIPTDPDAQSALYRSALAGRQMLVVLDNARDAAQVRPLLPGAATCLVLVTSRNRLTGLIAAESAHPISLDLLTPHEARQLLTRRIGSDRTTAEPDAVGDIITACARLPLALAIVAAHAATHPRVSLAGLAGELRGAGTRLDILATEDPRMDVRAVFSWSYQELTPEAARLFRYLGLHPGPDFSAPAAASLAGIPPTDIRSLLAELTRAHLLTEHAAGRYTFHDLLRTYAEELTHTHDTDDARNDATRRMLDHYLHTAFGGDRLLAPRRDPITLTPPAEGVTPERFADHDEAMAWFSAQRPVLLAAVTATAGAGFDAYTWQLAWGLWTFLTRQGHRRDQVTVWQAALTATQQLGNRREQERAHRNLARAHAGLGAFSDARWHLRQSLELSIQLGDRIRQAHAYVNLAMSFERAGKYGQALEYLPQALDLYRASDHQVGLAEVQNDIGWCHAHMGEFAQGLTWCERALEIFRRLGDKSGEASAWDSLGYANHHLGRHEIALECYRQALDLARQLGERHNESEALQHLGDTQHATGDIEAARRSWQQALTILEELDHAGADTIRAKLNDL